MDPITIALLLGASYFAVKTLSSSTTEDAAPAAGTAPVPTAQTGAYGAQGVAPSKRGHVIPTPPPTYLEPGPRSALEAAISKMAHDAGLDGLPVVRSDGLWVDAGDKTKLWRFRDCQGKPMGQPGYMPLRYKAFLDANIDCDGTPIRPYADGQASGGVDAGQAIGTGLQIAGEAATVAGGVAAAGGSSGVVAGVASAAAAGLAALGPVPGNLFRLGPDLGLAPLKLVEDRTIEQRVADGDLVEDPEDPGNYCDPVEAAIKRGEF